MDVTADDIEPFCVADCAVTPVEREVVFQNLRVMFLARAFNAAEGDTEQRKKTRNNNWYIVRVILSRFGLCK